MRTLSTVCRSDLPAARLDAASSISASRPVPCASNPPRSSSMCHQRSCAGAGVQGRGGVWAGGSGGAGAGRRSGGRGVGRSAAGAAPHCRLCRPAPHAVHDLLSLSLSPDQFPAQRTCRMASDCRVLTCTNLRPTRQKALPSSRVTSWGPWTMWYLSSCGGMHSGRTLGGWHSDAWEGFGERARPSTQRRSDACRRRAPLPRLPRPAPCPAPCPPHLLQLQAVGWGEQLLQAAELGCIPVLGHPLAAVSEVALPRLLCRGGRRAVDSWACGHAGTPRSARLGPARRND